MSNIQKEKKCVIFWGKGSQSHQVSGSVMVLGLKFVWVLLGFAFGLPFSAFLEFLFYSFTISQCAFLSVLVFLWNVISRTKALIQNMQPEVQSKFPDVFLLPSVGTHRFELQSIPECILHQWPEVMVEDKATYCSFKMFYKCKCSASQFKFVVRLLTKEPIWRFFSVVRLF